MIISKSIVVATLRERGKHDRADWVDRELPEQIDSARHSGLLATLGIDATEMADSQAR